MCVCVLSLHFFLHSTENVMLMQTIREKGVTRTHKDNILCKALCVCVFVDTTTTTTSTTTTTTTTTERKFSLLFLKQKSTDFILFFL